MLRKLLAVLLAAALLPSLPHTRAAEGTEETTVPETTACTEETGASEPTEEPEARPYDQYFGLLHAHTDISDGLGTVEEAFDHASRVEGLDFFAMTDHSNSFDNADAGDIALDGASVSTEWAAGKAAAAAVTGETFLGIFGYEMTWQEGKHLGHLNTFNTPGWESRDQASYADQTTALETYYQALTTVSGSVSQFNHPGPFYGEFENFTHWTPEYDDAIHLLEVGGEGNFTAYDQYTSALDAGWHLAPSISQNNHNGLWGDASDARTVVLAESLTEQSLFDAIRAYRVYATQDADLEVWYELNGQIMGSILPAADTLEITAELEDPTDASLGKVEVITSGGSVVAEYDAAGSRETVTLTVPAGYPYYYLRLTQPDGDIAVTAPVWVEGCVDLGIGDFTAGDALPVQGKELPLVLELYNHEHAELTLHSIELSLGETVVCTLENPGTVKAGERRTITIPYTHGDAGPAELTVTVTGTAGGEIQVWQQSLTLHFRSDQQVTGLLIDGSHDNAGLEELTNLRTIAASADMAVTVFDTEMPLGGELLLVTAPAAAFEEAFLRHVQTFVQEGGSLILCGGSGGSPQLNRLLDAVGSSMGLKADVAAELSQVSFQSDWCAGIAAEQFFVPGTGCTVDPGSGAWIVKNGEDILLACEETAFGGTVFVSGGLFLGDTQMPQPANRWDPVRANQVIAENILGAQRAVLPLQQIQEARWGQEGGVFRVKGYVTAGTANKYNTFPGSIYLQDDTGGIEITGFAAGDIQLGTPLELVGVLHWEKALPQLKLIEHRILTEKAHRYAPRVTANKNAMDYGVHGGELLKLRGKVTRLEKTEDGKGIARLVLKDIQGDEAIVEIGEKIFSGTTGKNTLAKKIKVGSTVQAMGLLHMNADGEPVLRVRNCDEVVHIPEKEDESNPDTGDWLARIAKALQG